MSTEFDGSAEIINQNLTEGDDYTFAITREDSNGNAIDISNWTFYLTIKNDRDDADVDAVVQKTVTSHTDPANGKTEIDLTNSDTADLQGAYEYDMAYETATGTDVTMMIGTMYFDKDVTEA